MEKICIFGAGALGGAIAAKIALAKAAPHVSVVARGAHLDAIRRDGLRLSEPDAPEPRQAAVNATDVPAELGPQDLVITGLKGHQLNAAADGIAALIGPQTRVLMILNGIPWWYFHGFAGALSDHRLETLDPDGRLWDRIGPQRVIGCVAYQGAEVPEPGLSRLTGRGRFILGAPDGSIDAALEKVVAIFGSAGIRAEASATIRNHIWEKLMGNASFNPISALTRARMNKMMGDPLIIPVVRQVMEEVRAVGTALGAEFSMTVDDRLEESKNIGPSRTSMLQDLLAGKALEAVPIVKMVAEMGTLVKVPTPATSMLYALVNRLDEENRAVGS